jgi:hypothetical protein
MQMIFQLDQRPRGKSQAQVGGTGSGCLDYQLLYFASMDPGTTRPFANVQSRQTLGLETFDPFAGVYMMKIGNLARDFDAVTCRKLPGKKTSSVETGRGAGSANQALQFEKILPRKR